MINRASTSSQTPGRYRNGEGGSAHTFEEFCTYYSGHGYRHLNEGSAKGKMFWGFVLIIGTIFFIGHVYVLTREYLQYKYHEVITMKSDVELTFPDVTICDSVIASDFTLIKNNEIVFFYGKFQLLLLALSESNSFTASFTKEEMEAITNWVFTTNYMISNLPKEKAYLMGSKFESLVVDCVFSEAHCNRSNFETFIDPNHLMCYTFKAKTVDSKLRNFVGPEYGLSLILRGEPTLNFNYNRNSKTYNTRGLHIDIHPLNTIPFVGRSGVYLRPGRSTFIDLNQKQFLRLDAPYSKCLPQQTVEILSKTYVSEPKQCFFDCVYKSIRQMCNCSSATFRGVSEDYREHCLYFDPIDIPNVDLSKAFCEMNTFRFFDNNNTMNCKRCPWNCNEIKYDMKISEALWPEPLAIPHFIDQLVLSLPEDNAVKEYYKHLKRTLFSDNLTQGITLMDVNQFMLSGLALQNENQLEYLLNASLSPYIPDSLLQSNDLNDLQKRWVETSFYRLNVFFSEPFVTVQKQVPSFKFQDYWSGIGGVLGIWAGASVLTLLEICSFLGRLVITKWFTVKENHRSRKVMVIEAKKPVTNLN